MSDLHASPTLGPRYSLEGATQADDVLMNIHGRLLSEHGHVSCIGIASLRIAAVSRSRCRSLGGVDSAAVSTERQPGQHAGEVSVVVGVQGRLLERADGVTVAMKEGGGPMRTYSLGALLLDREDARIVLGRTVQPLLTPDDHRRDGYVPNVVYSCGPIAFASLSIRDLIGSMSD